MLKPGEKTPAGPGTVIGANVKLVGALRDSNDIIVHGSVEGEVASEKMVTVGETAHIKGPVTGATVSIAGEVRGSVDATARLEILPTGKIFGNVTAKDLIIQSGALFVGKCSMDTEPQGTKPDHEPTEPKTAASRESKPEYEVE